MNTHPARSRYTVSRIILRWQYVFTVALVTIVSALYGQDKQHVYAVAIKLHVGGGPITGFLHSVNDSAVVILPGKGTKKGLEAALINSRPISIPTSLIKKLSIIRVRTAGHVLLSSLLFSAGYSVAYVLLFPIETPAGLIIYLATVGTATILTMDMIYSNKFKPTEPGFTVVMQKYCLVKSGLVIDGQ